MYACGRYVKQFNHARRPVPRTIAIAQGGRAQPPALAGFLWLGRALSRGTRPIAWGMPVMMHASMYSVGTPHAVLHASCQASPTLKMRRAVASHVPRLVQSTPVTCPAVCGTSRPRRESVAPPRAHARHRALRAHCRSRSDSDLSARFARLRARSAHCRSRSDSDLSARFARQPARSARTARREAPLSLWVFAVAGL